MTEDLLGGNTEDQFTVDPNKDYLQELVGDGKKFKTPQELARGKAEADAFIETMKRRQDELLVDYQRLRDENVAKAKLEELIDRLQSRQQDSSNEQTQVKEVDLKKPFDPKEIESLIDTRMEERELIRKQTENFKMVKNKLVEEFGMNYQGQVNERMAELGLTADDVNALAKKSPMAFFKTLGIGAQKQEGFQAPPRSTKISDNFSPKTQKRTWSYYQDLKKKDPTAYFSPKITNQMHEDYQALGTAFEDGDFHAI